MAITHQGTTAAVVESGRVLDVDISNYTLAVTTQYSKKPQTGISWATPYTHFVNGEGVYIMPEVGSLCWICFPSDGTRAFVLGWMPASDEGNFRARRQELNPGDIYLGTRDENFMVLRRGGVVQIGGGPLCQRIFLPITNTIRDFCENYALHTLGGDLEWTVQRTENDTDGKRPSLLSIRAREKANDAKPIAELLVGSHGSGDKTILSLLIKDSGDDGAAQQIELTLSKEGNVSWTVKKDVLWTVDGKYTITAKDEIKFHSDKKFTIDSGDTVEMTGSNGITIKSSGGDVKITGSSKVIMKSKVEVGSATYPVVMATPAFLTWLTAHMHPTTSPGAPTGPPMPPPAGPVSSMDFKTS